MNLMQLTLKIFLTLLYQLRGHQILKNFQIIRNLQNTEQCLTNQFLDNDLCQGQCSQYDIDCHYSCWKCSSSSSSNCLECLSDSNRFLENSVCKCQGNYYDENNELFCQRCRFPCLNCQGKQNYNCLSCQNQMILFENECKCGEHQFFNYVNFLCEGLKQNISEIDCHPTCSECNGSLNSNCLICKQDQKTILQSNICICKEGYYKSSVDNNCYQCHQNCKTCSGPANNECLSCNNNKSGSSCNCSIGYYLSQLIPNSQVCLKCHPTCKSCQGSGEEFNCLTCHSNATLQTSSQMCLCNSGYVWNGDSCIQCDTICGGLCRYNASNCCTAPCVQCLNPNCSGCDAAQTCTICQAGKTGVDCDQSCDAICKTCDKSNSNLCTSCNGDMIQSGGTCNCPSGKVLSGTSCVNEICASTCTSTGCIDGYYGTNCALSCDQSCKRCWGGNNTECNLCKSNAHVGSNNLCVCNFGYYMDATYNCYKCDYTCRNCSGSSTNCTDCEYTHRTLNTSNQCVCDTGYYDFKIPVCQQTEPNCGVFCGNCSFSSGYSCLACALSGTHRIDDLSTSCPCQNGYFDNGTQICEQCNYKCTKCSNATSCIECHENRSSTNCDCDGGFEEQAQVCVLISTTSNVIVIDYDAIIMKQYSSVNCNLINFANKISCQCLDGYYMQNSKCLPCHRQCKTCSIISTNCIECSLNYINPPSCTCVNGFQLIDNVCISCNQHCVLCSNNLCNNCLSPLFLDNDNTCQCTNGYYFDQSSNQCSNCQTQCNQCKYQSDYCTKCNFNRILPFKCICPEGTYELSQLLPCQNCLKQCFTCQTNASNCITCATLRINPPICDCSDGYYEDSNLNCLKCHKKCQTCQLNAKNCVECSQNRINSECHCNDGYYENNNEVCIKCHIKCKTCNGPNEYNCLTCDSTRHFIQSNSTCICIKGYYYENNLCNPCIYDVLECQTNYCGDGIKQSYEQCDDWNNINRDGCNSQCQIEESYQCTLIQNLKLSPLIYYSSCILCADLNCKSCKNIKICSQCKSGYFLDDNQCNPCDLHCKECSGPSKKQCTSCLFEIFSSQNCQLCEDTQGLYHEQGKCVSKCGDGILRLTEQCDDGNNIDGDGCSSTCKLEQLWICNSDNSTQSKCQIADLPLANISFENPTNIYQSNRYGIIKFNKLMKIDLIQVQQHWIQVIKNMNQAKYYIEIGYDANDDQYYSQINLDIKLYDTFQGMIYQINFTDYLPFDLEGQQLSNQFLEYQLGDYYKVSELQIITAATTKKISLFLLAALGGGVILGFLLQSLEFYWNTLDMLQLFSYLSYINVKFPYLHLEFLSLFKFAQMDFLNDLIPLSLIKFAENDTHHNYPLLIERDVQENLLLNLISIFVTYAIPIIIYIGCRLIIKINHKYFFDKILISDSNNLGPCQIKFYSCQIVYYLNKTARIYEQSFLFQILLRVHLSSLLDLNFAIFTTIYCWTQHYKANLNDTLQYLFANLIMLIQITIIIILSNSILLKKYEFESLKYKLKYGSLFEGFQITGIHNRYAALLQPFKKILFMASLLVFFNHSLYQIGLLTSLYMVSAIISIVLQPSINNLETTKLITQDFGILISLNFILIYYVQDNFKYFSQDTIELISYFHIGIYILMLSIQIIIDCYMQIKLLFEKYPKLKQCSTKKEVTSITLDNTNYYKKQQFIVIQPIQRPNKFNV